MMDNRMIDVAIGLVLLFALSSLLVSALHEIWTGLWKSRGGTLTQGVRSLMGDNSGWGLMTQWVPFNAAPNAFTRQLLSHPLLVSQTLGSADDRRAPSYLSADLFVTALCDMLSRYAPGGRRPDTPAEWLHGAEQAMLAARSAKPTQAPVPGAELIGALRALMADVDSDWPAYEKRLCAWYDSVMARAGGWYVRDTKFRLLMIGVTVAAVANLNPLVVAPRLWNDPALRQFAVETAKQSVQVYNEIASAPAMTAASGVPSAPGARSPAKPASGPGEKAIEQLIDAVPAAALVDQELTALKVRLFNAAAAVQVHPAGEAGRALSEQLRLLESLQKQVQARRRLGAIAQLQGRLDEATVRRLFETSILIDQLLERLEQPLKDHGKSVDVLRSALHSERRGWLPEHPLSARLPVPMACEAAGAAAGLCQLEALQTQGVLSLPVGWSWANWPGCTGDCPQRMQALQRQRAPGQEGPAAHEPTAAASAVRSGALCSPDLAGDSCARRAQQAYIQLLATQEDDRLRSARLWALYQDARRGQTQDSPALRSPFDVAREQADFGWAAVIAVLGWLLCGLAATLGAPFWFDLMGKLIKVRASGAPSSDAKDANAPASGGGSGSPANTLTRSDAPGASPVEPAMPPDPAANGALNAVEQALSAAQIMQIQQALLMPPEQHSGRFDTTTRQAIQAWQMQRLEAETGTLSAAQLNELLPPLPVPSGQPSAAPRQDRTPLYRNGRIHVLSEAEVRRLYGDIATQPAAGGGPGQVTVTSPGTAGGAQRTLVTFTHPLLGARSLQFHQRALPHLKAALDAIEARRAAGTLQASIVSCQGTLSERHIGHDIQKPLSRHTWGIAIDLNSQQNPLGQPPAAAGQPGTLLPDIVEIFNACGFAWGGDFSTPDGMHFELALRNPDEEPTVPR